MSSASPPRSEDHFVQRYLLPLTNGDPAALELKDDAALIAPRDNHQLVVTCDTLIQGRHFLFDGSPSSAADAAHKALAVNVSDLIAKGAAPRAYLMSLALPPGDYDIWMPAFTQTLAECQKAWGITLVGGDTVVSSDHLVITITAIADVPAGKMVTRQKAAPGEGVYLSGELGDATLGLHLCLEKSETNSWARILEEEQLRSFMARYRRPEPRVRLAEVLRQYASAAIDVSDGFVRDLTRLCTTSGIAADIDAHMVPISNAARMLVNANEVSLGRLFTGGDDYEIIACVPSYLQNEFEIAAEKVGESITRIGTLREGRGVQIKGSGEQPMEFESSGWDHLEQTGK